MTTLTVAFSGFYHGWPAVRATSEGCALWTAPQSTVTSQTSVIHPPVHDSSKSFTSSVKWLDFAGKSLYSAGFWLDTVGLYTLESLYSAGFWLDTVGLYTLDIAVQVLWDFLLRWIEGSWTRCVSCLERSRPCDRLKLNRSVVNSHFDDWNGKDLDLGRTGPVSGDMIDWRDRAGAWLWWKQAEQVCERLIWHSEMSYKEAVDVLWSNSYEEKENRSCWDAWNVMTKELKTQFNQEGVTGLNLTCRKVWTPADWFSDLNRQFGEEDVTDTWCLTERAWNTVGCSVAWTSCFMRKM